MSIVKKLVSLITAASVINGMFPINVSANDYQTVSVEIIADENSKDAGYSYTYEDFGYIALGNDAVEISDYTGSASRVVIPSEIEGKSVISIGCSAFDSYSSLTAVTIPDSITCIGSNSFEDCTYLVDVYYKGNEEKWKKIEIGEENSPLLQAKIHYVSYILGENCAGGLKRFGWFCRTCEKYYTDDTFAKEVFPSTHNAVKVNAKDATCTSKGNIEHWYCEPCGKYFADEFCKTELTSDEVSDVGGNVTHTGISIGWSSDDIAHWHECHDCGTDIGRVIHSGGTATCTDGAVCQVCGYEYEDADSSNHTDISTEWTTDGTSHWHKCNACGAEVDKTVHSGGTATCTKKAKCETCGSEYGDVDSSNHTDISTEWTTDGTSHWHKCNACGADVDKAAHSGGTATCTEKAKCEACGSEYGDVDSTNHTDVTTEWMSDKTNHWHKCKACSADVDKAAHKSSGAATYSKDEICTICDYVITVATGNDEPDEKFVERLYTIMLGRASDSKGKLRHVTNLRNGKTAAEVASRFVNSAELANMKLTNKEFVARMYRAFLNRKPSENEIVRWASTLDNGCSYGYVLKRFVSSAEFKKLCAECNIKPGVYKTTENRDHNENTTKFVSQMYINLLGRKYDIAGLNKLTGVIINGGTGADVGKALVLSTELANKKLTNREFVKRMYKTFIGRTPSDNEITRWANVLDNGCSYGYVLSRFVASAEFRNYTANYGIKAGTYKPTQNRDKNENVTAFVSRMYTKALNRTYDVTGLNNHTGRILKKTHTPAQIAKLFFFSPELKNKNLSDEEFVTRLYQALFNRNPDAKGKANWLNKMKNGYTREKVFDGFAASAEFKNLVKSFGL